MEDHALVSREDWTAARLEVLAEEKALMRQADALAAKRRAMPWTLVEKTYVFDAPEGRVTLSDLFAGRRQLAVYHFMFGPVQYLAIRYTERLADAGVAASVGSRGDSYDNALAESFNGLYKTEVIRRHGPWRGLDDVEYATLEYVDWFNQRRLHGEIGMIPPAEFEAFYYHQGTPALLAVSQ
jgi:hypothetical protein